LINLKNLVQIEDIKGTTATSPTIQVDAVYSTPFVTPNVLNDLVLQFEHNRVEKFREFPAEPYYFGEVSDAYCPTKVYHTGWNSINFYDFGNG